MTVVAGIPGSHLIAIVLAIILFPALIVVIVIVVVIAAVMLTVTMVAERHAGQSEHHYRAYI